MTHPPRDVAELEYGARWLKVSATDPLMMARCMATNLVYYPQPPRAEAPRWAASPTCCQDGLLWFKDLGIDGITRARPDRGMVCGSLEFNKDIKGSAGRLRA